MTQPNPLVEALERLSFCAQTTGGVAGPDPDLQAAIAQAAQALSIHRAASTVTPQGAGDFRELSWQLVRQIGRMTHSQDDGASHDDDANDAMDALVASAREIMSLPGTAAQPSPPAEGWRPIETAPKDGMEIIVATANSAGVYQHTAVASWDDTDEFGVCTPRWTIFSGKHHSPALDYRPTHWMPLPPAPTGEEE